MSGEEALAEGNEQIDSALEIFKTVCFSSFCRNDNVGSCSGYVSIANVI